MSAAERQPVTRHTVTRHSVTAGVAGRLSVASVVLCVCLALLEVYHTVQTGQLERLVFDLQRRLDVVEAVLDVVQAAPLARQLAVGELARRRRSVADGQPQTTAAGIPVVSRPYGHRPRHRHRTNAAMRAYDAFSSDTPAASTDQSLLPHHRSSAAFRTSRLGRVNVDADDGRNATDAPRAPERRPGTSVSHRRSRVSMRKAKRSRKGRLRSLSRRRPGGRRSKVRPKLESRGPATGFATGPSVAVDSGDGGSGDGGSGDGGSGDGGRGAGGRGAGGRGDGGKPGRRRSAGRGHGGGRRVQKMLAHLRDTLGATAAHFQGDASSYTLTHPHYGGNGILRNVHPNSVFVDWKKAPWMDRHSFNYDFRLVNGRVSVKKPGVYYLYAQINYMDDGDTNGFEIRVNDVPFVKCLTMEASQEQQKINTCFTGAVTYLNPGDKVAIRDMTAGRISMFLPDRSFFGLVRLVGSAPSDPDRTRHQL